MSEKSLEGESARFVDSLHVGGEREGKVKDESQGLDMNVWVGGMFYTKTQNIWRGGQFGKGRFGGAAP